MVTKVDAFEIDDDAGRVDLDAVWQFLSQDAYWSKWRTRNDVERQVTAAWRVVGCYHADGRMVGFARAFSDGVATAYLADVFVISEFRGAGLGTALIREMVERGPGREFRWMLHTADAHSLYEKFGFSAPTSKYLERPRRTPS